MKKKLYIAILLALGGAVGGNAGSVDLFNNPVGAIGAKKQPDLFNSPVGVIGSPPLEQAKPEQQVQPVNQAATPQAAQTAPLVDNNKQIVAQAIEPVATKSKLWSYQPVKAPVQPAVNNK